MPSYISGQVGVVKSGVTDLNVTNWSATIKNTLAETTNTSTAGWETFIPTVSGGDISVSAFFDTTASPFVTPPNLVPGQSISMTLQIGNTAKMFSATALIESVKVDSTMKDGVKYDMTAKTSGSVTLPT